MGWIKDHPGEVVELLAVMVRRAGGHVTIAPDESPKEFNIAVRIHPETGVSLILDEAGTFDGVHWIPAEGSA